MSLIIESLSRSACQTRRRPSCPRALGIVVPLRCATRCARRRNRGDLARVAQFPGRGPQRREAAALPAAANAVENARVLIERHVAQMARHSTICSRPRSPTGKNGVATVACRPANRRRVRGQRDRAGPRAARPSARGQLARRGALGPCGRRAPGTGVLEPADQCREVHAGWRRHRADHGAAGHARAAFASATPASASPPACCCACSTCSRRRMPRRARRRQRHRPCGGARPRRDARRHRAGASAGLGLGSEFTVCCPSCGRELSPSHSVIVELSSAS